MSSAPFLAIRRLFHLADREHETYPTVVTVLKHDMYVDDLLAGADNLEELQIKKKQITLNIVKI